MAKKKTERQKKIDAIWKTLQKASDSHYEIAEKLFADKVDIKTANASNREFRRRLKEAQAELKKLGI